MILSNIPPFTKLRRQELEYYAHLLTMNYRLRNIPFKERNKLLFTYDTKIDIATKMGIKISGVYNIITTLRNLKIIDNDSLVPKYVLNKSKELTFIFEDEHDNN